MDMPLIAYYSFSGTTRHLARQLAEAVSGVLLEIQPERQYSFDDNTAAKVARAEVSRGFCPKLATGGELIDAYDTVFIGSPNWFQSIAPPVLTFLRGHNFKGKTVVLFCTHGGGGFGQIESHIARECPGARLLPGLAAVGAKPARIAEWLAEMDLLPGERR